MRKRSALLTWNESEPSLCDLLVQPSEELNKQPSEHTTKHLPLREQLLQWGQGCQPTNPVGTTHGTVLVQLLGSLTCLTSAAEHRVRALGVLTDKAPSPAVPLSHIDFFILPNPCTAWIFYLSTCSRTGNAFGRDLSRVKAGEENVLITETLQKNPFISHGFMAEMRSCSVAYLYWFAVMLNYLSNK